MLDKITAAPKPVLIGVAALLGLVALAATIGTQRKQTAPDATQAAPAAAAEAPAQEAKPAAAQAAPAATAAAPVAVGLPPAIALDAPQQPVPGAVETVERVADDGTVTPLGSRRIEGQALALVDMATARNATGGAGWTEDGTMRVTRAGLVRVETAGQVTVILSNQSGSTMRTRCALAVGDPGNVVLRDGGAEQAGSVELLAGWHRVFVVASRDGWTDARCRLALKPASADAATVPDLFDLAKPAAAPAQAGEGSP